MCLFLKIGFFCYESLKVYLFANCLKSVMIPNSICWKFFRWNMCFNVTYRSFFLICCPNGTYYPRMDIWTRLHIPVCGQAGDETAQEESDIGGLILHVLLGLLILFALIARLTLYFWRRRG